MRVRFLIGGSFAFLARVALPGCSSNASPGAAINPSTAASGEEAGSAGVENGPPGSQGAPGDASLVSPSGPDSASSSSAPPDVAGRDASRAGETGPPMSDAGVDVTDA